MIPGFDLDFGLIWLSFTRILFGFALIWLDFGWIRVDFCLLWFDFGSFIAQIALVALSGGPRRS